MMKHGVSSEKYTSRPYSRTLWKVHIGVISRQMSSYIHFVYILKLDGHVAYKPMANACYFRSDIPVLLMTHIYKFSVH